jgi:DNA-binding NarL/FixJ family response regulator
MSNYPKNSSARDEGLYHNGSTCRPICYCGSFVLLRNLSDRDVREISILILSSQHGQSNFAKELDLGGMGLILKSGDREWTPRSLMFSRGSDVFCPSAANRPSASPSDLGLTDRQLDVLALMMQGKSNKAICRILELAEPTVKNHVTAILKGLKVTNRTEAVITVGELGWELRPISKSEPRPDRRSSDLSPPFSAVGGR